MDSSRGYCQIWAKYDGSTITVYQAYRPDIGRPAAEAGRFQPPWSTNRMTWIKPSFFWMMERSNWGRKSGQEVTLAIRISREGWESALSQAALTHPHQQDADRWREELTSCPVRIQWDPERDIRGKKLEYRSIQVGLGRQLAEEYNQKWIVGIEDISAKVDKIRQARDAGNHRFLQQNLPIEKVYPVPQALAKKIGITANL